MFRRLFPLTLLVLAGCATTAAPDMQGFDEDYTIQLRLDISYGHFDTAYFDIDQAEGLTAIGQMESYYGGDKWLPMYGFGLRDKTGTRLFQVRYILQSTDDSLAREFSLYENDEQLFQEYEDTQLSIGQAHAIDIRWAEEGAVLVQLPEVDEPVVVPLDFTPAQFYVIVSSSRSRVAVNPYLDR